MDSKKIMAENIKRLMEEKGVNATDVCNALGFKHNTFSDWINERSYPRVQRINDMAAYFNVDTYELTEPHSKIDKLNRYRANLSQYEEAQKRFEERVQQIKEQFEHLQEVDAILSNENNQDFIIEFKKMDKKKRDHLLAYMRLLNNES